MNLLKEPGSALEPTDQMVSTAESVQPEHAGQQEGGHGGPARSGGFRPTRMPSPLRKLCPRSLAISWQILR